jgi:hypothetical protein
MRIVPKNQEPRIQFFELRLAKWAERAAELGVPPELVEELAVQTAAAREALKAKLALEQAARAATLKLKIEIDRMSVKGAGAIGFISARAKQSDGKKVYARALLPPPKKRSKIGPPGTPTRFHHELRQNGWVALRWTCPHPRGAVLTQYTIRRSTDGGPFRRIGFSGERKFVDRTIPAGTASVIYEIQAQRSTGKGQAAMYNVNFGNNGTPPVVHVTSSGKAA